MPSNGNSCISRVRPVMIRWMLVDSSGSTKPPARPSATQLPSQAFRRRPVRKRISRGSISGSPSIEPQQARVGLVVGQDSRRRRPGRCRRGAAAGSASASPRRGRSRGCRARRARSMPSARRARGWSAASAPVLEAGPERLADQQPAKAGAVDEQVALDPLPSASTSAAMWPLSASRSTLAILPSMRVTPAASLRPRRKRA